MAVAPKDIATPECQWAETKLDRGLFESHVIHKLPRYFGHIEMSRGLVIWGAPTFASSVHWIGIYLNCWIQIYTINHCENGIGYVSPFKNPFSQFGTYIERSRIFLCCPVGQHDCLPCIGNFRQYVGRHASSPKCYSWYLLHHSASHYSGK